MKGEVDCPQCKATFKLDDIGYAEILKQVRDDSFAGEVEEKVDLMKASLKSDFDLSLERANTKAIEAVTKKEHEIQALQSDLTRSDLDKSISLRDAVNPLNQKILALEGQLEGFEVKKELAIRKSSDVLAGEITELTTKNQQLESHYKTEIQALKEVHQAHLEMRTALSTKMVGESLEGHCENEFNKIRATAFPNAEFAKDSTIISGSKGDYIFRDFVERVETISILFEMKNQVETTEKKTKNSQHFEKLDRDRKNKNCEYAVLVSLLETDSDLYNCGIVDISHEYEKMYVVRPQFFVPLISLLRNAALRSVHDRVALVRAQEQNIDVTNFVTKLGEFKAAFSRNYEIANKQFDTAIKEIDKSIQSLENTKIQLLKSGNQFRLANGKLEDLTIKRLTKDNATVGRMFEDALGSD